jgi:chromate reductase, NAD(P)H dehydrogenase (quinone)
MKLIGISGSLRRASCNTGLLRYCQTVLSKRSIDLTIVPPSLIKSLPLFDSDDEEKKLPESVHDLYTNYLSQADGFLFATCEYNGGISAPMKNALDWGSRDGNYFDNKPSAVIGAGGYAGTTRAQGHMRDILFNLNSKYLMGSFGSGSEIRIQIFQDEPPPFDSETGDLQGEFWQKELHKTMDAFVDWTHLLQKK